MKAMALVCLPLLLCGCSSGLGGADIFAGESVAPVLTPVSAPTASAPQTIALLALPPDAGAVASVREHVYANGVRQDIALRDGPDAASGNEIEVEIGSGPAAPEVDWLSLNKPTAFGIRGEILSRFPRMAMDIVQQPAYDRLGPIGLAIGRDASGLRCVFAWQWIDDLPDVDPRRATIFKAADSLGGSTAQASIRVRLCRRDRTLDQLAGLVEGLAIQSSANLRRILSLDRSSDSDSADSPGPPTAETLAPVSQQSLESALGPAPPPVGTPAPVRQARRTPAQPASARRDGSKDRAAQRRAAAPSSPPPSDGRRYLAPVAQGAPYEESREIPPSAARQDEADPNLPPQALSGPSGMGGAQDNGGAIAPAPARAEGEAVDSPMP